MFHHGFLQGPPLSPFIYVGLLASDDLGVPNLLKCNGAHALVPDL